MSKELENIDFIPFTCSRDCGGRCELVAWVKDRELLRIDVPFNRPDTDDMPRLIPCARGRSERRFLTVPERLLKPLKRVGPRGTEEFEPVSWDEALDEIAQKLTYMRDQHGPESILNLTGYGSIGGMGFNGGSASQRFFSFWDSITGMHGNPSSWCAGVANQWMLGGVDDSIFSVSLLASRLIILWGMNPAENRHGVNLSYYIARARDNGARIILIDPRYTDSGILADQWIPIRPGTDVALISAMAYIWESENLTDKTFMSSHTSGYEEYSRYVLGIDDNIPKTPEWAREITGIHPNTIRQLAYDYAKTKPSVILAGLGPQRSKYGEQTERALITIASMSGNMGIKGGGIAHGGRHSSSGFRFPSLPYGRFRPSRSIKAENWAKYILDGSLQPPVKMAYIVATNAINRSSNVNDNIKALGQLEYIVVQDQVMTPTARYADMVIPICTDLERGDIVRNRGEVFYNRQALNPAGESRTDYWVFSRLAERLGFGEAYTGGKTQEEWLEYFLKSADLDENSLKTNGSIQNKGDEKASLAQFRLDPVRYPLQTPSGLIQILCPQAEKNGLPAIPAYIENKPKETAIYPLQLITPHSKLRANSAVHPNPWLQRLEPHAVWINPEDAKERGINDGDMVEAFNQYGTLAIRAKLTQRIMPGVVCIYQGVWYKPDENGVDQGGCPNTLTGHDLSPTGGMAVHSEWVQIRSKSRE